MAEANQTTDDIKQQTTPKSNPNDFLTPLKSVIDSRSLNLLRNIVSKIIEDPKDQRRQDLNYATIQKKFGDCKPAFDVLYAIGFTQYTSANEKKEQRLKISITVENLPFLKYVCNELNYKYSDRSRVYRQQFETQDLMKIHSPNFRDPTKQLIFKTICPNTYKDCFGTMVYGRHKKVELPQTIPDPTDFIKNKLKVLPNIYEYISNSDDTENLHFYVNFADHNLFGYYGGSLFAQDEIMVMEHPILGSLREKLVKSYHSTKDKTKLVPKCDGGIIILNALKHGHFSQQNLNRIYGNRFRMADKNMIISECLDVCNPPIVDNIICIASIMGRNSEYKMEQIKYILQTAYAGFNGAKCETLYQTLRYVRNPNAKCSISECNNEELLWILSTDTLKLNERKDIFLGYFKKNAITGKQILEMSRKEFGAAIVAFGGEKKLNGAAMKVFRALKNYGDLAECEGLFDGYERKETPMESDEKKETSMDMKGVTVHTGNWGCGAFGGNVELHAILQIIAAVSAGVSEMYYHSVNEYAMQDVMAGCDVLLNEIIPKCKDKKGVKIKRDLLMDALVKKGYHWGTPNGT